MSEKKEYARSLKSRHVQLIALGARSELGYS